MRRCCKTTQSGLPASQVQLGWALIKSEEETHQKQAFVNTRIAYEAARQQIKSNKSKE